MFIIFKIKFTAAKRKMAVCFINKNNKNIHMTRATFIIHLIFNIFFWRLIILINFYLLCIILLYLQSLYFIELYYTFTYFPFFKWYLVINLQSNQECFAMHMFWQVIKSSIWQRASLLAVWIGYKSKSQETFSCLC